MGFNIGFYCSSNSLGGLELNILRLASWMNERGHKIVFYALQNSRLYQEAVSAGLKVQAIFTPKKTFDITGSKKLSKLFKTDKIEYIIASVNRDLSVLAWTKLWSFNKLKLLYLQQMQVGVNKKDPIHTLRYSFIDAWLAPMKYLEKEVKEKTKINEKKIHLVPLCIDMSKFAKPVPRELARKILNLPENKFILGLLGRLDEQKRQHLVIEALKSLPEEIILVIAGEETDPSRGYLQSLKNSISKNNLEKRVFIHPFIKETEIFYNAIDVFVMASSNETFGMVTVEALASGIPVLGSNAGGTAEIIEHLKTGYLFSPDNISELITGVNYFNVQDDAAKKIAENGRKESLNKYSHVRECELVEQILEKLQ